MAQFHLLWARRLRKAGNTGFLYPSGDSYGPAGRREGMRLGGTQNLPKGEPVWGMLGEEPIPDPGFSLPWLDGFIVVCLPGFPQGE